MTNVNEFIETLTTSALGAVSAAEAEEFARANGRLTVHDYLPQTFHDGAAAASKCEWSSHVAVSLIPAEVGGLAWVLIDTIMLVRFGPAKREYATWRHHTLAGTKIPSPANVTIAAFVQPVFGLPDNPPKKDDHLHGHVGEWLWHLLTKDNAAVRVQPDPKGDVTDGGADGFTIYENGGGALRFRLWESKKNTGSQPLSASLNEAYTQIASSGQRYVAKIVGTFSQANGTPTEMLSFIEEVPAAWTQGDELVGAGVTLATHQELPKNPFEKMSKELQLLDKPGQLRGLATSISCYDELAKTVRRYAWSAL